MKMPRWITGLLDFFALTDQPERSKAKKQPSKKPEFSLVLVQHEFAPLERQDGLCIRIINPSEETRRYDCGHLYAVRYDIDAYGRHGTNFRNGHYSSDCGDCALKQMTDTVRCCLCGNPVFVGGYISLHGAPAEERRWTASFVEHHGLKSYIGCLAYGCETGGGSLSAVLHHGGVHFPYSTGSTMPPEAPDRIAS